MKKINIIFVTAALLIGLGANTMAHAQLYSAVIKGSENAVLNKKNLDIAKRFMLKNGQTCTWSNMYNNNPCFATAHYQFYLNPDPGGPHNHRQWNIDCDPKKGDFNTLVICGDGVSLNQRNDIDKATKRQSSIELIDTSVGFIDKDKVVIEFAGTKAEIPALAATESSRIALEELLLAIKTRSKSKR
jgi:uncharacterized protein YcfL